MARAGATRAQARGVTDLAIGSSDWLGMKRWKRVTPSKTQDENWSAAQSDGCKLQAKDFKHS